MLSKGRARKSPRRHRASRREIQGLQKELHAIDHELDRIADAHLRKVGPRGETPAALAQRIVSERDAYRWFEDRPARFASGTGISDRDMTALSDARQRVGELIDHLAARLPAPADLRMRTLWRTRTPTSSRPPSMVRPRVPGRRVPLAYGRERDSGMALARALEELELVQMAATKARWIDPNVA